MEQDVALAIGLAGPGVDMVVHNADVQAEKTVAETISEDFNHMIGVDVLGVSPVLTLAI